MPGNTFSNDDSKNKDDSKNEAEPFARVSNRGTALAVSGVYGCLIAAAIPFAYLQGPQIPQIVSIYTSGIVIIELATAFLLLRSTLFDGGRGTFLLGCAYFYSALMGLAHLATFPGAILGTAPLVGSAQLTAPLFNAWRDGFAFLVLVAVLLLPSQRVRKPSSAILLFCLAVALSGIVAWLASGFVAGRVADIGTTTRFSRDSVFFSLIGAALGLSAVGLLVFRRGLRDRFDLWLMVALVSFCGDLLISTVGDGRYTLGWFFGRTSGFISACTLFAFFVLRFSSRQQSIADAALTAAKENEQQRNNALAELKRATTLFEAVINLTPDLIFVKDLNSRALLRNPAARFGRSWDDIKGREETSWHVDPEEARQVLKNDREVIESRRSMQFEEKFTTDKGVRTLLSTKTPLFDENGAIIGTIGVSTDITEREERAKQIELITRELSHRTKNLLVIIQAIARQSIQQSSDLKDFETRFVARLGALSRLHDLLIQQEWRGAPLHEIAKAQLSALSDSQIQLHGPEIIVRPAAAQVLAMIFHELATNATKYGALSGNDGTVTLTWETKSNEKEELFLEWKEHGGPAVQAPGRRGFGSIVIERTVQQISGAEGRLSFPGDGVHWYFRAPMASLQQTTASEL